VLERGEERVELGERGAVGGFEFVDGGDTTGEVPLKRQRPERRRVKDRNFLGAKYVGL